MDCKYEEPGPGVTMLQTLRWERQGLGDQNVSPWHPDILGCSIQFSALCQLTDRTELGHGVGSIDILIFETQGNGVSDSYSSPSRDVIRAITLLYCQDSLSNVGAGADCFRIEVKPLLAPTVSRSEPSNGDKWQFNLRQNPSLTIENNPTTFEWSVKLDNFRV